MVQLNPKPTFEYQQPKAICRTLVYNWAGSLLCTHDHESRIMLDLTNRSKMKNEVQNWVKIQGKTHQTAHWRDRNDGSVPRSNTNVVTSASGRSYNFYGATIVGEKELTLSKDRDVPKFANELMTCYASTRKQAAFAFTLLYTYAEKTERNKISSNASYIPSGRNSSVVQVLGKESGHCVGFFFSKGGIGARSAGCRFFDPNVGSWQFSKYGRGIEFFLDEWYTHFVNNTIKGDPGDEGEKDKTRLVRGYRLARFVEE